VGDFKVKPIDLMFSARQTDRIRNAIEQRFVEVLNSSQFIMGEEVVELEQTLAAYFGSSYAIGCANGTDALTLALLTFDLKPGDVVFTSSYSYVAAAESISILGGIPYFVDVGEDFNINLDSLTESIEDAKARGLRVSGIISVDLFGQPADYNNIRKIADEYKLFFISDAAQSFGATYQGHGLGELADITTTSFFPTKPLGCYGDGGMIFTNNIEYADKIRSLAFHGRGEDKYSHIRVGMNSRLDTLQAAVLLEKFKYLKEEFNNRSELAGLYNKELAGLLPIPQIAADKTSAWAVYQLLHPRRDRIIDSLKDAGIPSNVYYPAPMHRQPAYYGCLKAKDLSTSERFSKQAFCLPMHAYIEKAEREYIISTLKSIIAKL
jgi:dTDP-4-amino-4,6-dideoxygalactose transaminase